MSYINWTFDTSEELDAYDPLGSITIVGDQGQISEECTYLDGFFEALMDGIAKIEMGKTINIDPLIEPNDLEFDYQDKSNLKINYGIQQVIIKDYEQLTKDFKQAVKELIQALDQLAKQAGQEKRKLIKLRKFLEPS